MYIKLNMVISTMKYMVHKVHLLLFLLMDGAVKHPLLIINGEKEFSPIKRLARKWHQRSPASKYLVIPNAGHVCNQDNPDQVNEELETFIKNVGFTSEQFE
ncbi:alpha/beta fold hydrolase [Natranaerobius thermophilus]|uniref:alpha/beta fold hydrolase n=1 Tax=Natranaerobius thermophilus TaxID=375929 RepID=UPI0003220A98|nr:alpha/beta hydrolase [Natranaerobius thermophilus]